MKGLLLKDLINIRKSAKTFLLLILFYGMISMFMDDSSFIFGVLVLSFSMQVFTSFSYDEYHKWDRYALSLPVDRRDVVKSKYIFGAILILGSVVMAFLLFLIREKAQGAAETLIVALSVASSAFIYLGIIIPFIYKYGVEKARMVMVVIFALVFGSIMILARSGVQVSSERAEALLRGILLAMAPAAAAVYLLSYRISLGIYGKKEL